MVKKIDIEIDVKASGFGKDGRMFSHSNISKEIKEIRDVKELSKVFSGKDFSL